MLLDELQRRNYAQSTADAYVHALRDFAAYYRLPPDRLGPEQVRLYQLHMLRDRDGHAAPASFFGVCRLQEDGTVIALPFVLVCTSAGLSPRFFRDKIDH
jgi:hypothetical protein